MGKQYLAKGQFADAISQYHSAVGKTKSFQVLIYIIKLSYFRFLYSLELDPENYQSRYRRATCYLATGKSKVALNDLDEVLRLKPDFTGV